MIPYLPKIAIKGPPFANIGPSIA